MSKVPWSTWIMVWLPAQLVSLVTCIFLFSLGLILIEFLVYPLALGIAALLVGLTAVWMSNRLIHDNLRTPVNAVVGRCELAAIILSLLLIVTRVASRPIARPIVAISVVSFILAIVATAAAILLRRVPEGDPHLRRRVILWLILAFVSIPLVIYIASLFGLAGA